MCTKFGVDSSSRFPVRAWTYRRQRDRQTQLNALPNAGEYASVGNNSWCSY